MDSNRILYYAVFGEHTIGYMFSNRGNSNSFGISFASGLRYSPYNILSGPIVNPNTSEIRRATAQDFEDYNVSLPRDFNIYNQ